MAREDRPINRRNFFREGLRELLRPLAGAIEPLAKAARQLEALDTPTPAPSPTPAPTYTPRPETYWLRPPGAISESEFLSVCSRSGECVRVCPAQAIRIDPTGEKGGGAPYIEPDVTACAVCEGLVCTKSCPSNALQPLNMPSDIRMGRVTWHEESCLRTMGQECSICVDKCPLGTAAIQLIGGRVEIMFGGCVGCGACEQHCPTYPKSVIVSSRSQLEASGYYY